MSRSRFFVFKVKILQDQTEDMVLRVDKAASLERHHKNFTTQVFHGLMCWLLIWGQLQPLGNMEFFMIQKYNRVRFPKLLAGLRWDTSVTMTFWLQYLKCLCSFRTSGSCMKTHSSRNISVSQVSVSTTALIPSWENHLILVMFRHEAFRPFPWKNN